MKTSITQLKQYGSRGWQWLVNGAAYRTNGNGDGLWKVGSYEGQWADNYQDKQVSGTCQFSLPQSKNAARSKLYREYKQEESEW